jgi:hypothetical protein
MHEQHLVADMQYLMNDISLSSAVKKSQFKCSGQILDQVLRIFHANGKSKEFRYDTKPFPLFN